MKVFSKILHKILKSDIFEYCKDDDAYRGYMMMLTEDNLASHPV
jgi:hypothetical protein